jgi:hypothetical protein
VRGNNKFPFHQNLCFSHREFTHSRTDDTNCSSNTQIISLDVLARTLAVTSKCQSDGKVFSQCAVSFIICFYTAKMWNNNEKVSTHARSILNFSLSCGCCKRAAAKISRVKMRAFQFTTRVKHCSLFSLLSSFFLSFSFYFNPSLLHVMVCK